MEINVLYINPVSFIGGAEKVLINYLKNLDQETIHPTVLCPEQGPLVQELVSADIKTYVIPRIPLSSRNFYDLCAKPLLYYKMISKIAKITKMNHIDIIHGWAIHSYDILGFLKLFFKIPTVATIHDPLSGSFLSHARKKISVFLMNNSLDKTIAVSEATRQEAIKMGVKPEKIVTIHNGIPLDSTQSEHSNLRDEFNIAKCSFVIGLIGKIYPRKGHDVLIKAISKLINDAKKTNLICFVVGDSVDAASESWYSYLQSLTEEHGIKDKIIFTGWRNDIRGIMKSCNVIVVPSSDFDPFPTVVLEAMRSGVPIVATKVGGIPEMISDKISGILVNPDNVNALYFGLKYCMDNYDTCLDMAKKAKIKVENEFDISQYVKKMENFYRQIVGN